MSDTDGLLPAWAASWTHPTPAEPPPWTPQLGDIVQINNPGHDVGVITDTGRLTVYHYSGPNAGWHQRYEARDLRKIGDATRHQEDA